MVVCPLSELQELIDACAATTSTNEKIKLIKQHPDTEAWLAWTYNPFIQYGVTSANVKKKGPKLDPVEINEKHLTYLLGDLSNRRITGNHAIAATYAAAKKWGDIVYRIIDKDLKCRIDSTLINKALPGAIREFNVALAKSYKDHHKKVNFAKDIWYASRKLDGVRCLAIVDDVGNTRFFSRTGKEYTTLNVIADEIKRMGITECVLDGEACIVDEHGNEDFTAIVSEVRKKNHTIANPKFIVFDHLYNSEFTTGTSQRKLSARLKRLEEILSESKYVERLHMEVIVDQNDFDRWKAIAAEMGWEGFMIRKDATYRGKRTDELLKVKEFMDAEYKVISTEIGPIQFIENGVNKTEVMMTKANIKHKGNIVGVGSGWSIDQRRDYCADPDLIEGKIITVQYFEESKDKQGNISLRFPTVKFVHGNKRDT